jgi:hypothetical protein
MRRPFSASEEERGNATRRRAAAPPGRRAQQLRHRAAVRPRRRTAEPPRDRVAAPPGRTPPPHGVPARGRLAQAATSSRHHRAGGQLPCVRAAGPPRRRRGTAPPRDWVAGPSSAATACGRLAAWAALLAHRAVTAPGGRRLTPGRRHPPLCPRARSPSRQPPVARVMVLL